MHETFEQELRDALAHLYDPVYNPPQLLCQVLGFSEQPAVGAIQEALLSAITQLKPTSEVPLPARIRRVYDLLSYRYVQELTQDETSQRLGISSRHLRREQQLAVHALAQRLWEQFAGGTPRTLDHPENTRRLAADTADTAWRSQVRQELASLEQIDPDAVADVREAISSTAELVRKLAHRLGVHMVFELDDADLSVRIHPSLLRQILIDALQTQIQCMSRGELLVKAGLAEEQVFITIRGGPPVGDALPDSQFVREAVALQGGRFDVHLDGERCQFCIQMPHARQIVVLMIDDNEDLVHFFRRFAARTRYRLVHVNQGQSAYAAVQSIRPDLIVLDVMLPDIDGWEILTRLHDDPATRMIPIIVCSVIRQKELALALGATAYLPKPVRRAELLQAFEQALAQAA